MTLLQKIENYKPTNEQEERDKEQMIRFMMENPDYLERSNEIGHFTASVWTVNKERAKALMVYHKQWKNLKYLPPKKDFLLIKWRKGYTL